MALIDELKKKREVWLFNVALHDQRVVDECLNASRARKMVADLDRAIAAITPAIDFAAEQETAREQLEREPEIEAAPADEQDDASEFAADDDAPTEHISILTGDPAIEPESGLHGEAVEATATKLFDEHWNRHGETDGLWPLSKQPESVQEAWREKARELLAPPSPAVMEMMDEIVSAPEAPALNEAMHDEREQPVTDVAALIASGEHSYDEVAAIAYPEPQWNEPQPTEGYAPVTNPAADEAAKAHDWYDPKAVADRNRFNPFSIFRREDA